MLIIIAVGCNNAYWLTLLNVTNLPGNKFVNGVVLGVGECLAGFFSGFMIKYTSLSSSFQTLGILAVVLNGIVQFAVPEGSTLQYIVLFMAFLAVGGVYAALYVLIADSVPTS